VWTRDFHDDRILITSYRYTDFLVNEVTLDGNVVHLTDTSVPRHKTAPKVNFKIVLCYTGSVEADLCA